jgi:hypothetical protein
MKHLGLFAMVMLLCSFASGNLVGQQQESGKVESGIIKGKVFRSDTNESIPNSYILLMQEKESPAQVEHFDLRTNENGAYRFNNIPAGNYTVSIYAWFPKKSDVPCRNSSEAKTVDDGKVKVEWQRKSNAFMEIVTIEGFSVEGTQEKVKDFDLACK